MNAALLAHQVLPGGYHLLRLHAPALASAARPGNHIEISAGAIRRVFIMRADAQAGWVELLGPAGTEPLVDIDQVLSVTAPQGQSFVVHAERSRPLLLGSGQGMAPLIFLVDHLRNHPVFKPLVILASEDAFPFTPRPSRFLVPGMPHGVIATPPLLDDWGVPARLVSARGHPGYYEGDIITLARLWLQALTAAQREEVELFTSGPLAFQFELQTLAREHGLPCQAVEWIDEASPQLMGV